MAPLPRKLSVHHGQPWQDDGESEQDEDGLGQGLTDLGHAH